VLLLDSEGERAAAYLAELLAGLPPAVQAWVELLAASDAADPASAEAFEAALAAALARVTMVHLRDDVRRAGYQVGDATPLVLLVGHSTAPALLAAARAAQHVTSRGFPQTIRLALLADSRPHDLAAARALDDQARAQPWDKLLGWFAPGTAEAEPPLALCLLYQDYDERSWQWNLQPADVARSRYTTGPLAAGGVARAAFTTGPLGRATGTGPLRADAVQAVRAGGPSGPLAGAADGSGDASGDGSAALPAFEPEDVRYAVAEAAFALIASGLVDEPEFREQVRLNMPTAPGGGGEAERRFATLATSRLAFPRAQAEVACGAYEGAALLADWLSAIAREAAPSAPGTRAGRRTAPGLARPVRGEEASRFLRAIHAEIEDSEAPALRRAGEDSPPLSAEGVSQLYGFTRTEVDPARIFTPFRGGAIAREMAATGERVPGALRSLNERARVRYLRWRRDAGQVWAGAFAAWQDEMAAHVEATLLATPAGIGRARGYLSELRQKLTWLGERLDDRERFRAAAFERYLRGLAFAADDFRGAVRGARAYAPAALPVSATPSATTTPDQAASAPATQLVASPRSSTAPLSIVAPQPRAAPPDARASAKPTDAPTPPEALLSFTPAAHGASLFTPASQAGAVTLPLAAPDMLVGDAADDAMHPPLTITGAIPVIATRMTAPGASQPPALDVSAAPATPSGRSAAEPPAAPDAPNAPEAPSTQADPTAMPERLRRLIAQLGGQLGAEDGLLPSYGTVAAALITLLPFLAYAAVALAPALPWRLPVWRLGASSLPLSVVLVGVALALAVGVPTAVIYRRQAERISRVRRLLVGAHARWWAELCGRAEDALRREGVEGLRAAVDERLAAVAGFEARLREAQVALGTAAAQQESALASGPQARRDIFVAGGKRFPGVRMAQLHQRVQVRRAGEPLDPAHADAAALGAALRGRLRTADAGLLDLSSDAIAKRVADFGGEVCRPYLTGELVTVLPAIHLGWDDHDAERVPLGTLIERATPLYRPLATDSPRRLLALAAPEELALRDLPSVAPTLRVVTTPSPEWLLVAHLVSHGRPRWWRRPLIAPGRGASAVNGVASQAGVRSVGAAANGHGQSRRAREDA
jgi:hypothetical protein